MKTATATLLAVILASSAAGSRELTLRQALDLAAERSFELKTARARERASLSSVEAARRVRFPTLSIEGRASAMDDLASFELDIPMVPPIERKIGSKEMFQLDATLSLPLYTGGRIGGAVDQAEAVARMKEAIVRAESDRVSLAARVSFYTLAMAESMVGSSVASLERARIISRNVSSMFEAGAADSVDLLEADLAVTEASFALSRARIERRSAEIRFLLLLGLDPRDSLDVADIPQPPEKLPGGGTSIEDKPELVAASAGIDAGAAAVGISRSDLLPSIFLFGGYSIGKPNRDMFDPHVDDYFSIGAGLSWSLNLGGAAGRRTEAARFEHSALRLERDRLERDLSEAACLAREQMRLAHEEYLSTKRRLEITSRNYRLAKKRHAEGDLSTNRLLEIEKSLTAAQDGLFAAGAAYYIRYSGWLYATGSEELKKGTI